MRRNLPLFLALTICSLAAGASALAFETSFPAWPKAPARIFARPRADAAMQAVCKEVDVAVDEGYGVSSHERKVVCENDH